MADVYAVFGYRYKGIYYLRRWSLFSGPENLGADLVAKVPTDPTKFERWVLVAKGILLELYKGLKTIDGQPFEGIRQGEAVSDYAGATLENVDEEEWFYEGFHPDVAFDFGEDSSFYATYYEPHDLTYATWTYIYDLDNLIFTIEGSVHFRLDNLPRPPSALATYIYRDGCFGHLCRAPSTPAEHCANLFPPRPSHHDDTGNLQSYDTAQVRKMEPSAWSERSPPLPGDLSRIVAEGVISGCFPTLGYVRKLHCGGFLLYFRDVAKDVLTASCPISICGSMFTFDEVDAQKWFAELKRSSKEKAKGVDLFWFRGRLILLTAALDIEEHFKSSVGRVLRRVQELRLKECTAILFSLDHIAVIIVSGGSVSCSDAIPFIDAYGRDEKAFDEALGLIAHYLPPPVLLPNASFSSRFPLDILVLVMQLADPDTAEALGRTSKALRYEWVSHPRIGRFTLCQKVARGFVAKDADRNGELVEISFTAPKCVPYDQFWKNGGGRKVDHGALVVRRRTEHYFPNNNIKYHLVTKQVV